MRVALFSPLNPIKSGIADYTQELLPHMAEFLDLDIYIDQGYSPSVADLPSNVKICPFELAAFRAQDYDAVLYHMGNYYDAHHYIYSCLKRHPGVLVLHDYVMQGFYAEQYQSTGDFSLYAALLERYYGDKGREIAGASKQKRPNPIWESPEAVKYPLCEEVLEHAEGIIVHSQFVRRNVQSLTNLPLTVIPHHGHIPKQIDVAAVRRDLGVKQRELLLCAAGFVGRNKRFEQILAALKTLKEVNFRFVIAGEDRGRLLNGVSDAGGLDIQVLGHLPLEKMEAVICASDICLNLRYPTMGESSGVLIRMMGYGKPVLVSDVGAYAEFPDYTVLKIAPNIDEIELIRRFILELSHDVGFRRAIGREARRFVERECGIAKCARQYVDFLRTVNSAQEAAPLG